MGGGGHLPAPAHPEQMQGVRRGEHLPTPASEEPMQGVRGAGVCQHQRRRSRCKECGSEGAVDLMLTDHDAGLGAGVAVKKEAKPEEDQRQRSRCKE